MKVVDELVAECQSIFKLGRLFPGIYRTTFGILRLLPVFKGLFIDFQLTLDPGSSAQ